MPKRKVLGVVNAVLSFFFLFAFFSSFAVVPITSVLDLIEYLPSLLLLVFTAFSGYSAFKLLSNKQTLQSWKWLLLVTAIPLFWFLLMFFGHFFASSFLFVVVALVLVFGSYFLAKKFSSKMALFLSLTTLLVSLIVIATSFEEDYCWRKGDAADNTGREMVIATQQDAKDLKEFNIEAGTPIGKSFRVHMLCHTTFSFSKALQEKYFLNN